jgi:hypothetical protein
LRVVHNRLHLHAYKARTVQVLKLGNKHHHFQFAIDILSNNEAGKYSMM